MAAAKSHHLDILLLTVGFGGQPYPNRES